MYPMAPYREVRLKALKSSSDLKLKLIQVWLAGWTAMEFCADVYGSQMMNHADFSSFPTMRVLSKSDLF